MLAGLVHLKTALVGPSNPRVLRSSPWRDDDLRRRQRHAAQQPLICGSPSQARALAAVVLHVAEADKSVAQDEDVLQTWFSSSLFPFSAFGWSELTEDFKSFSSQYIVGDRSAYPVLLGDARLMMSLRITDQLHFKAVYLYALMRDKYGLKMSQNNVHKLLFSFISLPFCPMCGLIIFLYQIKHK